MKGLRYFIVITRREYSSAYADFFESEGIRTLFETAAQGTASEKVLEYLSLGQSEKTVFCGFVPLADWHGIKKGLASQLDINENGNGIALTLPVVGIGGKSAFNYLVGERELSEEDPMEEFNYSLIISIVNHGFSTVVMDAARALGARGGTIIKAKGTGAGYDKKFFGVSITEDKDMVYIVAKKEHAADIMRAVMEKAGAATEARGAVFSLPVDDVVGVPSLLGND